MTTERSRWAWGWADREPSPEALDAIAAQALAVLGLDVAPPRPALTGPHAARALPPPRVAVPEAFRGFARADDDARARHAVGKAFPDQLRALRGELPRAPDAVLTPPDERAVEAVLAWCSAERVAVIPFGGGTSVVAGVEADVSDAYRGVFTLSLAAFDKMLDLDVTSRAARLGAGMTGPQVESALAPHGLTLRHFPQSFEFSTVGGWVATRAGGHFATVYTHIDDLLEAVRMVTPAGVFATARVPASGAGPAPERLVLGSEGALGVVTEAWLRVRPRPRWRRASSVRFTDFHRAVDAVRALSTSGLYPANCRLLDAREAALHRVSADPCATLLVGFEGADHDPASAMDRALDIARAHGGDPSPVRVREAAQGDRDAASHQWREAFVDAPYLQSALLAAGFVVDTFETACTWSAFDALDAGVRAAVTAALGATCTGGAISCRFTHVYPDGPAPYYTFVGVPRGDALDAWRALKTAASDALARHGGTITHHHAVGRTHRPWYDRERPDLFAAALRAARHALDPAGVMNPGVLIDP